MTSWHEYHQYALENGGMDDHDIPDGDRSGEGEVGPEDPERKPSETPPCVVCGSSEKVLCFPDNPDLLDTICPDCCENYEHKNGDKGHRWQHDPWERDYVCIYCGIFGRCTDTDFRQGGD